MEKFYVYENLTSNNTVKQKRKNKTENVIENVYKAQVKCVEGRWLNRTIAVVKVQKRSRIKKLKHPFLFQVIHVLSGYMIAQAKTERGAIVKAKQEIAIYLPEELDAFVDKILCGKDHAHFRQMVWSHEAHTMRQRINKKFRLNQNRFWF